MPNPSSFIPISALPALPTPLAFGNELIVSGAGVSYKIDARKLVLPTDMIITWGNQRTDLPGSRTLIGGAGISVGIGTDEVTISASTSNQLIVFNQTVVAALATPQEDWDPTGWNQGLSNNRLEVTPSSTILLGGLDSTGAVDGQIVVLMNESGAFNLRLAHQSVGSATANQFICPGGGTYSLVPYQCIQLMKTANGWRIIS